LHVFFSLSLLAYLCNLAPPWFKSMLSAAAGETFSRPEEYGGNGLGLLAHALISPEIARVHSAARVYLNMQAGPAVTLFEFGNKGQKKKQLPGLLSGESIGLFAITEPDAGSDVAAMKTTFISLLIVVIPRYSSFAIRRRRIFQD
jgi:hypothetical protein